VRRRPDENVVAWLAEVDEEQVFMSVVSLGEIRRGVDLLPAGRRRDQLEDWIADDLAARLMAASSTSIGESPTLGVGSWHAANGPAAGWDRWTGSSPRRQSPTS
jgi:hypothetical protein